MLCVWKLIRYLHFLLQKKWRNYQNQSKKIKKNYIASALLTSLRFQVKFYKEGITYGGSLMRYKDDPFHCRFISQQDTFHEF